MHLFRITIYRSLFVTIGLLALGIFMAIVVERDWVEDPTTINLGVRVYGGGLSLGTIEIHLRDIDLTIWGILYLIGLAWMVFLVERYAFKIETQRAKWERETGTDLGPSGIAISGEVLTTHRSWNPFDPASWYYIPTSLLVRVLFVTGIVSSALLAIAPLVMPRSLPSWLNQTQIPSLACAALIVLLFLLVVQGRLRQSLTFLGTYSILFCLMYLLAHWHSSEEKSNSYDLPAGGGSEMPQASSVKIKKVVRKKFVLNPYSSIIFSAPPPIDQVPLQLVEETANQYKVGQGSGELGDGEGDGAGFGMGKETGKIRLIRLKHADPAWSKNMGIGGDYNLLAEFVGRYPKYKGKTGESTESMEIAGLNTFPEKRSPPLVYVAGISSFSPSAADKETLKKYLTQRHGMILGDDLGGGGFKQHFINVMNEVTGVTSVPIARDDVIHRTPHDIPQLPIVVAHGGTVPLGWKIDGRWVAYYHPGALSDAWRDDRAGIRKNIADQCYLLGINILYYSHREYGRWLKSQKP